MAFNGHTKRIIINGTLILMWVVGSIVTENKCVKGLQTVGYTVPSGDITLEYGAPLDIICTLKEEKARQYGENASSLLKFNRNNVTVSKDLIEVLNSTSIKLHIDKPSKVKEDNYYCLFEGDSEQPALVCLNTVTVGTPPQNVTDFNCVGLNYEYLICTWTGPENYVKTDYNLSYTLKHRTSRFLHECPKISSSDNDTNKRQYSCLWSVTTKVQYRQAHDRFVFYLGVNNTFGSHVRKFNFDHFKHVIPNAPEQLRAVATSPHSVKLTWTVPSAMLAFPPGVHHRVLYIDDFEKSWHLGGLITNITKPKDGIIEYNLTGLKFAHTLYDIRVSMRSAHADDDDESIWSKNASETVYTLSKVPDRPPRTNLGSFEIVNNHAFREAFIYWQQISREEENGKDFSYHVEVYQKPTLRPVESSKAYVKFENLSLELPYKFFIWSKNEKGLSSDKSVVYIPGSEDGVKEPSNFIKVVHSKDGETSDLYELGWQPPKIKGITNYTIFWCNNVNDRPYQCVGNLSWVVVPNNTVSYNLTLPKSSIYQFAISTNTFAGSSGMLWAQCTIISGKNRGKINILDVTRAGSTWIEVKWQLDCKYNFETVGFVISYCPISKPEPVETSCEAPPKQLFINGSDTNTGMLTNLKPYTLYRLQVSVKFKHFESQPSDPVYNLTNEAAPSVPRDLEILDVSNSSISIRWKPPLETNGHLKYYKVHYNDIPMTVEPVLTEAKITNLGGYTNYFIWVEACTVTCSEKSEVVNQTTKMWEPAGIDQPTEYFRNKSFITIVWNKPNPPRGPINYYEVKFIQERNSENKTLHINVTDQRFDIIDCGDSGKYNTFYVSVRAVNIINGKPAKGPWSGTLNSYCTPNEYTSWIYIVISVSIIFFVVIISYLFKKLYIQFKHMQNIDPKLPDGLASAVVEYEIPKEKKHPEEIIDRHSQPDEEYLLERFPSGKSHNLSGDSSGCSSGHESRSSSLQSGTHLSTSDSGTEQPRSPSLSDELRLRQRTNVSSVNKPVINKSGYVKPEAIPQTTLSPKPKPAPPGNYCVFGIDPKLHDESESPYVSLTDTDTPYVCDVPSESSPYVTTSEIVKPANPGYVVAGIPTKDILVPDLLQPNSTAEEKSVYVKAAPNVEALTSIQFPWQQRPVDTSTMPKTGYVCVGDAPPMKTDLDVNINKGYVPHKQFDVKSLKKD